MEVIEKYNLKFEIENDKTHFELVLSTNLLAYQLRHDNFRIKSNHINELVDILNDMYQDYEINEYKEMLYITLPLRPELKIIFGYKVLSEDEKETNRINYLIQRLFGVVE